MRPYVLAGLLLLLGPVMPTGLLGPVMPAGRAATTPVAETDTHAGMLLVATPDLADPNFDHTVVLVLQDDDTGALGLIVNRPLGGVSARKLLANLHLSLDGPDRQIEMYQGGPVQPGMGFVLYDDSSNGAKRPGGVQVVPGIAVTGDKTIIKDIAEGKGPKHSLPLIGYAGWGPGQLDAEISRGDWTVIAADPKLIFDTLPEEIWQKAWRRRGIDL